MQSVIETNTSDEVALDFAALLEQSFEALESVQRGELLTGTVLALDHQGMIIDVGLKRDAVLQHSEFQELPNKHPYQVGQSITIVVVEPEDREGNFIVSIRQARAQEDWDRARDFMDREELYTSPVLAANRGGLIIPFGELRGFVPASHVLDIPRGLDDDARSSYLQNFVGRSISVKVIEVSPQRRRLVFSQKEAQRERREEIKHSLIDNLKEGDIIKGRISSLRDFGAFVDLGGADGLIHISELAWRRIKHPAEVLQVGDEVDVYVLQLDRDGKRIGLSLKRLTSNPWDNIASNYKIGQMVQGRVSRVVSFGAFIELEDGIEALLHVSQMGNPAPNLPEEVVSPNGHVVTKVINLEPERQRIGLSLIGMDNGQEAPEAELAEEGAL